MENSKKIMYGILAFVFLIVTFYVTPKMMEDVGAGEIVMIQDAFDGELHTYSTPGMRGQWMGTVTHYKKSNQFWFNLHSEGGDTIDLSLPVKWYDGGKANLYGSVRYDLPTDEASMIAIHTTFGSQEAIEHQLIKTNVEKSVTMVGPLMTSKESYAEKKNELIYYIEDQASKGVYRTKQREVKEIDPLTGTEKMVTKVEVQNGKDNLPLRQEISPITTFKVKLYNISINEIKYDDNVEAQIKTQQQATMAVQTAIAVSKEAEQRALTVAKQGEADAAKAKWEQEVIKAKVVTEAESNKRVAELEVQTAELIKRKLTLEGEGEAAKKRAMMVANGALEQKLETWLKSQEYWAKAFAEYQGNIVPNTIMGGGSSGNGAVNFMDIMGAKAARDLNLDMRIK